MAIFQISNQTIVCLLHHFAQNDSEASFSLFPKHASRTSVHVPEAASRCTTTSTLRTIHDAQNLWLPSFTQPHTTSYEFISPGSSTAGPASMDLSDLMPNTHGQCHGSLTRFDNGHYCYGSLVVNRPLALAANQDMGQPALCLAAGTPTRLSYRPSLMNRS